MTRPVRLPRPNSPRKRRSPPGWWIPTASLVLALLSFRMACAEPGAATSPTTAEAVHSAPKSAGARAWETAEHRSWIFSDCAQNARRLLQGWIEQKRDPQTHLYSRGGVWDYHDEAADHYSSLVLIAHHVQPELIEPGGTLYQTLLSARRLCATDSGLPVKYDLATHTRGDMATYDELAEWLRDGLIRIAEVLGTDNIWYDELERLTDAMLAAASQRGGMARVCRAEEFQGNMLQTLSRLYVMSGEAAYLDAAEQIAQSVLPRLARGTEPVRVEDHGCELVPGLAELFVVESRLQRPGAAEFRDLLRRTLDRVLADYAHPETGLFCQVSARRAQGVWPQPTDTWGYVLFAYENYDRATGEHRYTAAVQKPLRWLIGNRTRFDTLKTTLWPRCQSSDDWSDSYESMIVLWNRFPEIAGGFEWLDWATLQHVHRRAEHPKYGPFTSGHFDGSTGRTLCLHMMLCSHGVRAEPLVEGLGVGAVLYEAGLCLAVRSDRSWRGRLRFDGPRPMHHACPIDWARINEMPAWFVVQPENLYAVAIDHAPATVVLGRDLIRGLAIELEAGMTRRLHLAPAVSPSPIQP